ncbi:hypothetical protein M501DRAFT_452234 [Patellaria atrata CBS 101060]|uniref:Uncharacterized protein n=1 Tax=Patellaria atrata CBS 101060 TaxID=1346257 RepID=A0A9P4VMP6_9PEZI|nr:hypothetical protein M501DRAFT_452234 [Patellaria atrata CBS 101060]
MHLSRNSFCCVCSFSLTAPENVATEQPPYRQMYVATVLLYWTLLRTAHAHPRESPRIFNCTAVGTNPGKAYKYMPRFEKADWTSASSILRMSADRMLTVRYCRQAVYCTVPTPHIIGNDIDITYHPVLFRTLLVLGTEETRNSSHTWQTNCAVTFASGRSVFRLHALLGSDIVSYNI